MKKNFLLDFEFICKNNKMLIGLELGKKFRKYFEDLGVDFKKIEEDRNIICLIPDILNIDESFIKGFIGDRIEDNGINIFMNYDVCCYNSDILISIFKIIKNIIKNADKSL